jgi:hypothetical protein
VAEARRTIEITRERVAVILLSRLAAWNYVDYLRDVISTALQAGDSREHRSRGSYLRVLARGSSPRSMSSWTSSAPMPTSETASI